MRIIPNLLCFLQSLFDDLIKLYLFIDPHGEEGTEIKIEQLMRIGTILHGKKTFG